MLMQIFHANVIADSGNGFFLNIVFSPQTLHFSRKWRARERALLWQICGDCAIALVETAIRAVEGARAPSTLELLRRKRWSHPLSLL